MALLRSITSLRQIPSLSNVLASRTYFTYNNEPTHPIPDRTPKWVSPAEAVSVVKSGNVCQSTSCRAFDVLCLLMLHFLTLANPRLIPMLLILFFRVTCLTSKS